MSKNDDCNFLKFNVKKQQILKFEKQKNVEHFVW